MVRHGRGDKITRRNTDGYYNRDNSTKKGLMILLATIGNTLCNRGSAHRFWKWRSYNCAISSISQRCLHGGRRRGNSVLWFILCLPRRVFKEFCFCATNVFCSARKCRGHGPSVSPPRLRGPCELFKFFHNANKILDLYTLAYSWLWRHSSYIIGQLKFANYTISLVAFGMLNPLIDSDPRFYIPNTCW